jgi:hypothetical protein
VYHTQAAPHSGKVLLEKGVMRALLLNVLLGASLFAAPLLLGLVTRDGVHIPAFFRFVGLPSAHKAADVDGLTCDGFGACPEGSSLVASPFLVHCGDACNKETCCFIDQVTEVVKLVEFKDDEKDDQVFTCDDFVSCPEGWSLVSSPSLVQCAGQCEKETCCSKDQVVEIWEPKHQSFGSSSDNDGGRRLFNDDNSTTTTTVTTVTATATTVTATETTATATATTVTATATTITGPMDTNTTTVTTTTVTPTTTTVTLYDAPNSPTDSVTISGTVTFSMTGNAQDFIDNDDVKAVWKTKIASMVSVPSSWVEVAFSLSRRRLQNGRFLQTATVTLSYTITIPANAPSTGLGSGVDMASITSALASTDIAQLTQEITAALTAAGVDMTAYTVTVTDIGAPQTVTTTTTEPPTEDDSLAFTKAVVSPAHALALLAVALSAMSA